MELYRKYRPKLWKHVVGHPDIVRALAKHVEKNTVPHVTLFSGASGVGKTTLALILKDKLGCEGSDFNKVDCADFKSIDTVRKITRAASMLPMWGKCRVWLMNEVHELPKASQDALLDTFENPPDTAYFFLCTTNATKLLPAIKSRCTEYKLGEVSDEAVTVYLQYLLTKSGKQVPKKVVDRIVEVANGCVRKAAVILEQVIPVEGEKKQLSLVLKSDTKQQGIEIARALISGQKWPTVAKILREVEDSEETIRAIVLSYCTTILLSGKILPRAAYIINHFEQPFYETAGKSSLTAACFAVATK